MNTAALDTMAFDKFEVADMDYLTSMKLEVLVGRASTMP